MFKKVEVTNIKQWRSSFHRANLAICTILEMIASSYDELRQHEFPGKRVKKVTIILRSWWSGRLKVIDNLYLLVHRWPQSFSLEPTFCNSKTESWYTLALAVNLCDLLHAFYSYNRTED